MTRATRSLAYFALATIVYLLFLFDLASIPFISDRAANDILPVIPWWLLVSFGSYALGSLGLGLVNFRDCPEAYEELMKDIQDAQNDLRAKGVTVD